MAGRAAGKATDQKVLPALAPRLLAASMVQTDCEMNDARAVRYTYGYRVHASTNERPGRELMSGNQ
jgi:hypothetical protein